MLNKAIDNFTECLDEANIGENASFCLLYLAISAKLSPGGLESLENVEEPEYYAGMMKQVNMNNVYSAYIAWAYVYLNNAGSASVGEEVLTGIIDDEPARVEGYLMLLRYLLR
jgi:hypothetical protein